jgi:hypothetical protein
MSVVKHLISITTEIAHIYRIQYFSHSTFEVTEEIKKHILIDEQKSMVEVENIIHARKLQKDMLIGVSKSPCFTAWESINPFSLLHRYCTMLFTWLDIKRMELFLARVSTLAV